MDVIAVIPARMGSSRYPGKPLAEICGMAMVGHCWHRTKMAKGLSGVFIATCDQEIADYAASIGAHAIMTSDKHERATDRTAEAMLRVEAKTGRKVDAVLMVQGDEPLITPEALESIVMVLADPAIDIANLMGTLATENEFRDTHNVKVVTNNVGDALYMSREPIPSNWKASATGHMHNQMGIIAFRRDVLIGFNEMPPTPLEIIESVDMNRVIENGGRIRMVSSQAHTIGVDTPADLAAAEKVMASDALFQRYRNSCTGGGKLVAND